MLSLENDWIMLATAGCIFQDRTGLWFTKHLAHVSLLQPSNHTKRR